LDAIKKLQNCEAHATYILSNNDINVLKSLKINITCEPKFYSEQLYY